MICVMIYINRLYIQGSHIHTHAADTQMWHGYTHTHIENTSLMQMKAEVDTASVTVSCVDTATPHKLFCVSNGSKKSSDTDNVRAIKGILANISTLWLNNT